jgi:hypothetical protein
MGMGDFVTWDRSAPNQELLDARVTECDGLPDSGGGGAIMA